jgi:hypothetical protein
MVVVRLARGEDQGDGLGQQPPRRERQALRRGPVQPLRVIHQAGQRLVFRRGGQQAQSRQPDEEAVQSLALLHSERDRERVTLRLGQLSEPTEHRRAQLVEPANASSIFDSTPRAQITRKPSARPAA